MTETFTVSLFGMTQLTFEYRAIGIPDLVDADYADSDNPAVLGFRALMRDHKRYSRAKPRDRVARVLELLSAPTVLRVDDNRRTYLIALIEKYLPLTSEERADFQQRIKGTEIEQVEQIMTYYQREGYEKGISEGKALGEAKGVIQGLRKAALQVLTGKFGSLPPSVRERVESLQSEEELNDLLARIVTAATLNDLGLAPA